MRITCHLHRLLASALLAGCMIDSNANESSTEQAVGDPPAFAKLIAWYDAAQGVGLSGSEVVWWEDRSGHGNILGRGNPTAVSISLRSYPADKTKPALLFEPNPAGAGYLVNSSVATKPPFTVAMVFHPLPYSTFEVPVTGLTSPTVTIAHRENFTLIPPRENVRMTSGIGESFRAIDVVNAWSAGPHNVVATWNFASSELAVDGVAQAGSLGPEGLTGLALSNNGRSFRGYIAEVLVYQGALDWFEHSELVTYLATKYPQSTPPPTPPLLP